MIKLILIKNCKQIRVYYALDSQAEELLYQVMNELGISVKGYNKTLKLESVIVTRKKKPNFI